MATVCVIAYVCALNVILVIGIGTGGGGRGPGLRFYNFFIGMSFLP